MPFAETRNGYRFHYADRGTGEPPVLLHCSAGSHAARARMLANDMAALRAGVARDRPGGGVPGVPLLALAGALDPLHDAVEAYARGAGGAFVSLPGRNHITAFLAAEEVTAAAENFLARAPALAWCAFALY